MSAISLRLPNSLHNKARELAKQEGISINQFIATALAEKMSALMTTEYLKMRGKKSIQKDFDDALSEIPDIEPKEYDRL